MRAWTPFFGLVAALLSASAAPAETYPSRPVTVIVPYVAGGGTDLVARLAAQALWDELGQSFVVDNRAGGGGLIGVEGAARAPADGYTLLFSSTGPVTISPLLFKNRNFDPLARLEPIVLVAVNPLVMVVRNGLPAGNVDELIALSKKAPGALNMASAGNGSIQHLAGELFQARNGVKWQHVPFRGSAPALAELIAGRLDVMVDAVPTTVPLVKDHQLRALAVLVTKRALQLPEVPTLAEVGYPGFDVSGWHALFASKGTPPAAIATINAAVNRVLAKPAFMARLAAVGAEPEGGTPERLAARMRVELRDWGEVIRNANVAATD
jgi:tripartite-type tricarboxylate transporter receptor subunit TctC